MGSISSDDFLGQSSFFKSDYLLLALAKDSAENFYSFE
jgi:hypothetical protein